MEERDSEDVGVAGGEVVCALYEYSVLCMGMTAEGFVAVAGGSEAFGCGDLFGNNALADLAAACEVAAGNGNTGIVNDADGTVDSITHLVDNTLIVEC